MQLITNEMTLLDYLTRRTSVKTFKKIETFLVALVFVFSSFIGSGLLNFSANAFGVNVVESIATGYNSSYVVKSDGSLWVFGEVYRDDYSYQYLIEPTKVLNLTEVKSVVNISDYYISIYYINRNDELFSATIRYKDAYANTSTPVLYALNIKKIMDNVLSVSYGFSADYLGSLWERPYILKKDHTLWRFEPFYSENGELIESYNKIFDNVLKFIGDTEGSHCLMVKTDGSLWAWGSNDYGQLGDGTTDYQETPKIIIASGVKDVNAYTGCSMAIKTDGSLWAWGANWFGQLGDGTYNDSFIPKKIMDSGVKSFPLSFPYIWGDMSVSAVIKANGELWMWGRNEYGQAGTGENGNGYDDPFCFLTPQKILSNVKAVSTGIYHTIAVREDGSLWTWGFYSDPNYPAPSDFGYAIGRYPNYSDYMNLEGDSLVNYWKSFFCTPAKIMNGSSESSSGQYITNKTFTIYQNKNDASNFYDSYEPASGASISFNGASYTANSSGIVNIPVPQSNTNSFTVSKSGFISTALLANEITNSNNIYLEKSDSTNLPVFKSISLMNDYGSVDLRSNPLAISKGDNALTSINVNVDWRTNTAYKIYLCQGDKKFELTNGINTLSLSNELEVGKIVYIMAQAANGRITRKILKISVSNSSTTNNASNSSINFGSGGSFGLPSNMPLISGMELNMSFPLVKVTYSVEGNKIKGVISASGDVKEQFRYDKFKVVKEVCKNNSKRTYKQAAALLGNMIPATKTRLISEGSMLIYGFIEGTIDEKGVYLSDTGIVANFEGKNEWTFPSAIGPVPVFAQVFIAAEINAALGIKRDNRLDNYTPYGSIHAGATLGMGVGLGYPKLLSVSGGASGTFDINMKFFDTTNSDPLTVDLSFKAYLKATLWGANVLGSPWEKPLGNPIRLYPRPQAASRMLSLSNNIYDTSNYELMSRDYINNSTNFVANSPIRFSMAGSATNTIQNTIMTNSYPLSEPQLVSLGSGKQLLVWLDDDRSRSAINRTALYYSYYNGTSWSAPQQIQNDGTADFAPSLKVINNIAYLVWQNSNAVCADTTSVDYFAKTFNITFAKFNNTTNNFTNVTNVISDTSLDMLPKITGINSTINIAWVKNTESNSFGTSGNNQILTSTYDGSTFTEPMVAKQNLNPIDDLDIGYNGSTDIIAYSMKQSADISNENSDIYIVKNSVTTLVSNATGLNSKPTFSSNGRLYWYNNGQINYINDFTALSVNSALTDGETIANDRFKVVSNANSEAIVFEQSNELYSELHSYIHDEATSTWSDNIQLTELNNSIQGFGGFLDSTGKMSFAINRVSVTGDLSAANPYGQADLCTVSINSGYNLSVGEVLFDNEKLVAGNDLSLEFDVKNNGQLAVNNTLIEVLDSNDNVLSSKIYDTKIKAGETASLFASYIVPSTVEKRDIKIRITPQDLSDYDLTDNVKTVTLDYVDVAVESVSYNTANNKRNVYALISNRGLSTANGVNVSLLSENENGEVLATQTITSLNSQDAQTVVFEQSLGLNSNQKAMYVKVSPITNESSIGNNTDFVAIDNFTSRIATLNSVYSINRQVDVLTGIGRKTNVSGFSNNFISESGTYRMLNSTGQVITSGYVGTGTKLQLLNSSNQVADEVTAVVYGDLDGDADISINDLAKIKRQLLKMEELDGAYKVAGDIGNKGNITISDLIAIKKHLLGLASISQS